VQFVQRSLPSKLCEHAKRIPLYMQSGIRAERKWNFMYRYKVVFLLSSRGLHTHSVTLTAKEGLTTEYIKRLMEIMRGF